MTHPPPPVMPTSTMLLFGFILTRLSAFGLLCPLYPRLPRHLPQTLHLLTLHPSRPSFVPWLMHSKSLRGQYHPQILQLPLLLHLLYSSWLCHLTRSPSSSTTQVLLFHQFDHVIRQMLQTLRHIGRLRRFIALLVVKNFGTTNTSWRLVMMVNGSMVESSSFLWLLCCYSQIQIRIGP